MRNFQTCSCQGTVEGMVKLCLFLSTPLWIQRSFILPQDVCYFHLQLSGKQCDACLSGLFRFQKIHLAATQSRIYPPWCSACVVQLVHGGCLQDASALFRFVVRMQERFSSDDILMQVWLYNQRLTHYSIVYLIFFKISHCQMRFLIFFFINPSCISHFS